MPETKKQNHIIVKPEFNEFVQAVDEYTAQLPLVIRESIRQVLYCEYEQKYETKYGVPQDASKSGI